MSLVDEGRSAGWSLAEITTALIDLADHQMLADAANQKTDADMEEALKRLGL